MKKCYAYSKLIVIGRFGLLFVAFFIISIFTLTGMGVPKTKESLGFFVAAVIIGLGPCFAVLIWIFITLKVRISIDEDGIEHITLFRKVNMKWPDIVSIEKKCIYSQAGLIPEDLEIKDRHDQKIRVFYFVENCETLNVEKGIKDFEAEIRKHIDREAYETRTASGNPIIKYAE